MEPKRKWQISSWLQQPISFFESLLQILDGFGVNRIAQRQGLIRQLSVLFNCPNFASHLWTLLRGVGLRAWIRSRPWRRTVIKSADRRIRTCLMTAGRLIVNCSAIRPAGNSFPASNSRILRRLRSAIDRNILSRLLLRRERSETIVFVSSRRHTNICRDSGPIPG